MPPRDLSNQRLRSLARTALVAIAAVAVMGACQPVDVQSSGSGTDTNTAPIAASAAQAASDLKQLKVTAHESMTGYKRDNFKTWDSQGGGCDTRDVVLKRDGKDVTATSSCKITHGTWVSPYNGKTYTSPTQIQIDHVVPLGNAWVSGAQDWSASKREDFANDLTRPQLLAVDGSDNESKGDDDPSAWRPPNHDFWCSYAKNWITVKAYWKLTITATEESALHEMLQTCA